MGGGTEDSFACPARRKFRPHRPGSPFAARPSRQVSSRLPPLLFTFYLSLFTFGKSLRDEGEDRFEARAPIVPRVAAVAHAVLQRDVALAHEGVEADVARVEEVVVAAVHPPAHVAHGGKLFVGEFAQQLDGRVVHNRTHEDILVVASVGEGVQQTAQRAGRAEELGVLDGVGRRSAAAHRESGDGAVCTVAADAVVLLDGGQELLEEEALVAPARHVEVTHVGAGVVLTLARGVGHDDNHPAGHALGNGVVGDALDVAQAGPVGVAAVGAVQQVEHGVLLRRGVVARREVDRTRLLRAEDRARDGEGFDAALTLCGKGRAEQRQQR